MEECPPERLAEYLQGMKALGYTLVGLEQTMSSKMLGQVELPKKMVLVLGEEKEGIPPHIIQVGEASGVNCSCWTCAWKFRSMASSAR